MLEEGGETLFKKSIAALLVMILFVTMGLSPIASNSVTAAGLDGKSAIENQEYIVKWIYSPIADGYDYRVIEHDPRLKVSLIQILSPYKGPVIERLQLDPNVEYVEKNVEMSIHADPNITIDTKQQYYLDTTGLRAARNLVALNKDLTIAILDTGVDLTHPDLIDNLVIGTNLIDSKKAPQDDQGHGTMVAGIIASTGKDRTGYEGILPNTNIMPIKVMASDGRGDALKVSQGIRYAVDNGADIISLSLADVVYSKKMKEEVEYAEEKGVLVVAVTGNGGNPVGYPAAYPTVLSVGAVDQSDKFASYSNYGPEVDVVAPGTQILAPQLGGGYGASTGTSMAGPQVVGLAALIMSKYPEYTPAQIRNLIRYSAKTVGTADWNAKTGYGRIDAIAALMLNLPDDMYEPNDTATQAKVAPLGKQVNAKLSSINDKDWYKVDVAYDGKLRVDWTRPTSNRTTAIKVTIYDSMQKELTSFSSRDNSSLEANVKQGSYFIKTEAVGVLTGALDYSLISSFRIYDDAYGNNHTPDTAYVVPVTQKQLIGTLARDLEEDWFEINIPIEGEFSLEVFADNYSIDTVVTVIRPNGQRTVIDKASFGGTESSTLALKAGKLRIGIRNYYEHATNGEYTLQWNYQPSVIDAHEPNNSIYTAKTIRINEPVYGYIASLADYDYFKFTVAEEGLYQVEGDNFPVKVRPSMSLYNPSYERIALVQLRENDTRFKHQVWLEKGTYFVRIDARSRFTDQLYSLHVTKVAAAFKDLANNWARESINRLASIGVINGYEDKTFRPNAAISRAEFAHLLVKSLELRSSSGTMPFTDVKSNYWARESIMIAYQQGIVTGYDDKTFRPEAQISRSEMVAMLVRGLALKPVQNSNRVQPNGQLAVQKFSDIKNTSWYTNDLSILLQLSLLTGFEDGTFRPNANTSRAEVATMLERIWYK